MNRIDKDMELFRESMSKNEIYIPSRGLLAGWHTRCDKGRYLWEMFEFDNMHFPLGDAFFQYGIRGIIQKSKAALAKTTFRNIIITQI